MVVVVLSLACVLDFVGGAGSGAGACTMSSVHFRIITFTVFYSWSGITDKCAQILTFTIRKKTDDRRILQEFQQNSAPKRTNVSKILYFS